MADKHQIEKDKKNWAQNLDDALNSADTYWTKWSTDGVVLMNGFVNAQPNDPNACLAWRNLVRRNGDIVFSEIQGTIHKDGSWPGGRIDAFQLPSNVQIRRPGLIGSTAPVNSGNVFEGNVSVGIGGSANQWTMSLAGKRVDGAGTDLNGWIGIHFLSC